MVKSGVVAWMMEARELWTLLSPMTCNRKKGWDRKWKREETSGNPPG